MASPNAQEVLALCEQCQRIVLWAQAPTKISKAGHLRTSSWTSQIPHLRVQPINPLISASQCPFCSRLFELAEGRKSTLSLILRSLHPTLAISVIELRGVALWQTQTFHIFGDLDLLRTRAIWRQPVPTMSMRMETIKTWISGCSLHHNNCKGRWKSSPKRLLDVSKSIASSTVQLISTETSVSPYHYTTLSHCWGAKGSPGPLKTTKLTKAAHYISIAISDLPQTFRDAVAITHELGVQFLWIDSLCIVQDDIHEWQEESAKMASIYQASYLTIAATSSPHSGGGCLHPPYKPSLRSIGYVPGPGTARSASLAPSRSRPPQMLQDASINQRGWVLQELVLSVRTVHFTENQMYWQCCSWFESEDGCDFGDTFQSLSGSDSKLASLSFDMLAPQKSHRLWLALVENYCGRKFSYQTDKMQAIAGIVQYFETITGRKHLLGLWSDTVSIDLEWSVLGQCERIPELGHLPSWSWLPLKAPSTIVTSHYHALDVAGNSTKDELELVHWDIKWSGVPLTSELQSFELRVRGLLKKGPFDHYVRWSCVYDSNLSEEDLGRVECLLLYVVRTHNLVDHCLLVLPSTKDDDTVYRRVGTSLHFYEFRAESMFYRLERTELSLV